MATLKKKIFSIFKCVFFLLVEHFLSQTDQAIVASKAIAKC